MREWYLLCFFFSWYCIFLCIFVFGLNLYMSKTCPRLLPKSSWKKLSECLSEVTEVVLSTAKCDHEDECGFVYFKEQSMSKILTTSFLRSLTSFYSQSIFLHVSRRSYFFFSPTGQLLDCSHAKPPADNTVKLPTAKGGSLLPTYTPWIGTGRIL